MKWLKPQVWCDIGRFPRKRHRRWASKGVAVHVPWKWVPAWCTALLPPFSLLRATFDSKEELITTRFPLPQADYLQGCSNIRLRTARKMPFGNVPLRADVQLLIWVMNCLSILTISGLKIALTT